jgi:5-methyltetrahydrofolate--homocysteine methyltransferase
MGTTLQAMGLSPTEPPELWNLTQPGRIGEVHRAYLEAGAQILETNTFGGTWLKLSEYGLGHEVREISRRAVTIAREAILAATRATGGIPTASGIPVAGPAALVAGSIGPTGRLLEPLGELTFDDAVGAFAEQAQALAEAGADLLIIETMGDLAEIRAAVIGARSVTSLPIIAQMTYGADSRTFTGTGAASAAVALEALGADTIGVNCSGGPRELLPVVQAYASVTGRPISVIPNAGVPRLVNGQAFFDETPQSFAAFGVRAVEAGAAIVGGCCGTTPDHIRELAAAVRGLRPKPRTIPPRLALASRTRTVFLLDNLASGGLEGHSGSSAISGQPGLAEPPGVSDQPGVAGLLEVTPPLLIGERINPTARKKLAEDIRSGAMSRVVAEARAQAEAGAHVLDVNVGVPGIDEPAAMKNAVQAIQAATDLPLCLDSADPAALEAGLKAYAGKALVNSATGEDQKLAEVLPLVKKYGAAVIGLCLDERGIPETAQERVRVAEKIVRQAGEHGISREDVLIDCLVLTAGAAGHLTMETPGAVREVKDRLGLRTVLGVSNVSYGLPHRETLNSAYLIANLVHGLDAAIANPLDQGTWTAIRASRVITGKDRQAREYIAHCAKLVSLREPKATDLPSRHGRPSQGLAAVSGRRGEAEPTARPPEPEVSVRVYQAILDGNKSTIVPFIQEARRSGLEAGQILNGAMIPAMEEVGRRFAGGVYFLPQVMLSAEAMKLGFDQLSGDLGAVGGARRGKVILATVEGDIHDIGKNIVGVLLGSHGYQVIDLGKSVPASRIVEAAREHAPDCIGLSALMTTTMPEMKRVIAALSGAGLDIPVVIGGAVTTRDYAESIGASAHAEDAREAVKVVERTIKLTRYQTDLVIKPSL